MKRTIIEIDEGRCNGCGLCANACHEGAIGMVNGKARLLRDDYCDGLGDCLPACPTGAIRFVEREAAGYSAEAVKAHKEARKPLGGCPGAKPLAIAGQSGQAPAFQQPSALRQWPVQIKLAPLSAPFYDGAHLLIAADCAAYACGSFHADFMRGKVTLIGCPKLDDVDYAEKLAEIIGRNEVKSVTIVRMEVPCCGGLEHAVKNALQASGKFIPWRVVVLSTSGEVLAD
jgi:NAD-dependent dihydropyrimidine dehydrogenase PreA subunit